MTRTLRCLLAAAALASAGLAQVNWTALSAVGAPRAFCGHAWDTARNRLVTFGGQTSTFSNATVEWNGTQWLTVTTALSPSARARVAMAYDEARGVTVLFGGNLGGSNFSAQTWTWDGTNWTLKNPANVPPSRFGAAMAYDSVRQVVVMFGGFVPAGTDIADVWEWDGTNWTQRTFAGPGPTPRGAHRMAFDKARGVSVLYGGFNTPTNNTVADAWSWNGTSWTQLPGGPGSLCDQALVYDPGRQRVLLFGGLNIVGSNLTDLGQNWEWDGTSWTQRTTTLTPSPRSSAANAFDPINDRMILAGGITAFGSQPADTLAYRPINRGTVADTGIACPSSSGPMDYRTDSRPYIGLPYVEKIASAPPTAIIGVVIFGGSDVDWLGIPLPLDLTNFGAPGCFLNISLDVMLTTLLNNGQGSVTWVLPAQPTILGVDFYTQALVFDPLSTLPFQVALTAGHHCTVGAP